MIELKDNNMYAYGYIFDYGEGLFSLERALLNVEATKLDKYHIVRDFDRLDRIAYQYYKFVVSDASKYWWVIADTNLIDNPLDLTDWVGKELLVPDLIRIRLDL